MTESEREEIYVRGLLQVVYNYGNTFGMNKEEVRELAQEKGIPALTKQNYLDVRRAIQENATH